MDISWTDIASHDKKYGNADFLIGEIINAVQIVFRQFYHDALPLIGTSASVSLMRSLIASQQTTSKENDIWLTSLAFIKNPTRDLMRELKVCNINIVDIVLNELLLLQQIAETRPIC